MLFIPIRIAVGGKGAISPLEYILVNLKLFGHSICQFEPKLLVKIYFYVQKQLVYNDLIYAIFNVKFVN